MYADNTYSARYVLSNRVHTHLLRRCAPEYPPDLLLVCRQISQEAAMLQYPYCVFAFDHWLPLEKFLLRCSSIQRCLIRTIRLKPRRDAILERSFWNFGDTAGYIDVEKLEGLRTVVIEKPSFPSRVSSAGEEGDVRTLARALELRKPGVTIEY
jgi:hypothetical protein